LTGGQNSSKGALINNNEVRKLTVTEQKVIKASKHNVPWTNSDKVQCVMFKLPSCEIKSENSKSEDSDMVQVKVYSLHTLPYILGMVNGRPEQLFIDSGSSLNLANAESYANELITPVNGVELTSASGHSISIEGKVILSLLVGTLTIKCEFMLIKGLEMKLLLGNSVFCSYDFKLSYEDMRCEFSDQGKSSGPIPLLLHPIPPGLSA
jgi:hypothetical protein